MLRSGRERRGAKHTVGRPAGQRGEQLTADNVGWTAVIIIGVDFERAADLDRAVTVLHPSDPGPLAGVPD